MLALDSSEPDAFVDRLVNHVCSSGSPELVLAWLHQDRLGPRIAKALAPDDRRCQFFQVRGSAAANPANEAESFLRDFGTPESVDYFQVILGFHSDECGSRWLNNPEIAAGILAAIASPRPVTIVGVLEPWSSRP